MRLCFSLLVLRGAISASLSFDTQLNNGANQHILAIDTVVSQPHPQLESHGFVSLGDSYSAGIGTGLDDDLLPSEGDCRRGQHAYPLLLHLDQANHSLATNTTPVFQWLSCTGAQTTDILSIPSMTPSKPTSQIDALNTTTSNAPSFATLSIGGNDLGFFDVMNACIFRFYSFYSGTCAAALAAADAALSSPVFEQRLTIILHQILDKIAWERHPTFHITVTGYARFFNALTPECDDMSLGVWYGGPKLTRDIRTRMNALVLAANDRLRRTVEAVDTRFSGRRVVFVDYDAAFEGHRFCEPGVVEPAYNRTDSWFFLVGGPDNARNETTWPNGTNGDPEGTRSRYQTRAETVLEAGSPLVAPEVCLRPAEARGDWGERALCYMATAMHRDPSLRLARDGFVPMNGMWWVPTYYGKTFHPRSLGCEVIRDRIYLTWDKYGLRPF